MYYSIPPSFGAIMRCMTLCFALLFFAPKQFLAQCSTPPAQPACGGTALVDNDNLTAGVTRVVNGTSSFSNLTINGGTLIVCGTLNLSSFTFTSGNVFVCVGATMNVNTAAAVVFGNNCNWYNYGTTFFASSIVTGQNNLIMNCIPGAFFNIPFNQFVLQGPNTQFVNYGTFSSSFFIVQSTNSPAPVCSGIGSVIITGFMINQYLNAFTSPSGPSCIQITNQAFNSQPMTTTPNVNICFVGGSGAGQNFGNATVTVNCTTCAVPLPVDNIAFEAACSEAQLLLEWTVQSEEDCSNYQIEVSENASDFQVAREVFCEGPSVTPITYSAQVDIDPSWNYYTRVKRIDMSGNETYSQIRTLNCLLGSTVDIFPTYVTESEVTVKSDDRIIAINMYSMDGRIVKRFDISPDQKIVVLNIGEETAYGEYLLTVETPAARVDRLIHVTH